MVMAEGFGEMISINKINLKCCNLTSKSIDLILGKLTSTQITQINLNSNSIMGSINISKFLCASKSIEVLKLSETHIDESTLREIGQGLIENSSLKELDLSNN